MKIIVDCFGGDNSPQAQVIGAVESTKLMQGFDVVLVGKTDQINAELEKLDFDENRIEVLNADEVLSCEDKPTVAIREKKESSMVKAFDLLKNDEECVAMVSSGSTGALLAGAVLKIGRIRGISRPALAPTLPTITKKGVMLIDCGANADCKPINLLHFALMGSSYYRNFLGVEKPKVGILSNGTEDEKGNELTKASFELIKNLKNIEFVGNIEARDILSGNVDVVVSDGFSGNVALKSIEGGISMFSKVLKQEIKKSFFAKIGAIFMRKQFKNIKSIIDYNSFGGAVILGVEKNIIKAHGSASNEAIKVAVLQAVNVANKQVIDCIKQGLSEIGEIENV